MGSEFSGILSFFGSLFSPIHTVFDWVFYLPVFNILIVIFHLVNNFALAIVLLTLLIRFALYPLTRKQLASTRKMQELAPRLKQLQAQHRGDPQAAMAAQRELYKEHGVSMYGGCLPLLIQMPFLYALFYACEALLPTAHNAKEIAAALHTVNGQIYSFLPHLSSLPPTQFFWTNLAAPDQLYILPIIAGILTFVQMRMAVPVQRPGAPKDATTSTTKNMQYIMPLFTIFIGTRFPAGLALYWCVSTGFSAAQQYLLSGWGSFWVGVPGMEHLVPAPKDVVAAPAIAASRGAGRGAIAAPTQPEKPTGFLASMRDTFQALREQVSTQATAQALNAQEKRANNGANNGANGARVVEADAGSGAVDDDERQPRPSQPNQQPNRRPRASKSGKSGAMLVRPSDQGSAADLEASTKADRPEERLKRDAQEPINGMMADTSASGGQRRANGASNGANGASNGRSGNTSGANSGNQRRNQQSRGRNRKGR